VEPALQEGADHLFHSLWLGTGGVHVHGGGVSGLAAEEVVDRHGRDLSLDVPQGLVHAAESVIENRSVAPVRRDVAGLPYVLDVSDVSAEQEGPEVVVDRGGHGGRPLSEGGAPEAVESRLAGLYLYDRQPDVVGLGEDNPDVSDCYAHGSLQLSGALTILGCGSIGANPGLCKRTRTRT